MFKVEGTEFLYKQYHSADELGSQSRDCIDVDECQFDVCDANGTCTNAIGSYSCECNDGFDGDGITCHDRDECLLDSPCHESGLCVNTYGGFECYCGDRYIGNGFVCRKVDDLAVFSVVSGSWSCADGYSGDEFKCEDINECDAVNACHADASCTNSIGSYDC